MTKTPTPRLGRALTLEEHRQILEWNMTGRERWPSIDLALNYPQSPEMLGVVECGQVGPTLLLWTANCGAVVEPLSGGTFVYPTLAHALEAISRWVETRLSGHRVPFGSVV